MPDIEEQQLPAVNTADTSANSVTIVTTEGTIHHEMVPDTAMYYWAEDLPKYFSDSTYLDSCITVEKITTPVFIQEPGFDPMSVELAQFNALKADLLDVEHAKLHRSNTHISIKEKYAGYVGKSLNEPLQSFFWYTPLMLVMFFAYAFVLVLRKENIRQDLLRFFGRTRTNSETQREQHTRYGLTLTVLTIVCSAIFSVEAWQRLKDLEIDNYLQAIFSSAGIISVFILLKVCLTHYLRYVFFSKEEEEIWYAAFKCMVEYIGIVLFPVILCISYSPSELIIPMIKFGCFYIILAEILFSGYQIIHFFKGKLSIVYLVLYLCTIEVLPAIAMFFALSYTIEIA